MNKPIAIDGYMSDVAKKSIVTIHDELYEQSNYQKLLIHVLTESFQSLYFKGKLSEELQIIAFDVLVKNNE